jgi:hypothetical protein
LGLTLPCFPYIGYLCGEVFEVVSGEDVEDVGRGVSVPQDQAIAILGLSDHAAAAWWRAQGYPQADQYFFFSEDEIEIISGVTEAPMGVFDDMETGDWRLMN